MATPIIWDDNLLARYNTHGPRYTSYPTALEFSDDFTDADLIDCLHASHNTSLSLYIHIPFCHELCYYCGCNKIVTRHQEKADEYLDHLQIEIEMRSPAVAHRQVQQVHLGGGTPSFLTDQQLARLTALLRDNFTFSDDPEFSIELDPRSVTPTRIATIASLGFNRMSFGVQDINPEVQKAINRYQDCAQITSLVDAARIAKVGSVNLDLVYGLPHQDMTRFAETVNYALSLKPDRISLFSYAHMPKLIAAQRKIKDEWLLTGGSKAALFRMAMNEFVQHGYVYLGLDHFALPSDELSQAFSRGQLHRNFQGYTTHEHCDLLGLGISSISAVQGCFSQNNKELKGYYKQLTENRTSVSRGVKLSADDEIRSYVIKQIMCNLQIDFADFHSRFGLLFNHYFASEAAQLEKLATDDIITMDAEGIRVTPRGRLLIRNVAMVFDAYLVKSAAKFSATL